MRGRRGPLAAVALAAAALLVTAGCTAAPVDPQRSRTVVVTVDVPFESLNAATTAGRTPGSTLVRGLVQDRFTTVDQAGAVVPDTAIGTVQKVSDDPLTVRYTIAPTARWSDGVPVTGDDLLLEWAARSGQLDETPPPGATGPNGATATAAPSSAATASPTSLAPAPTTSAGAGATVSAGPGATASSGPGATASSGPGSAPAADTVWFGAVSPVLVHAPALPTVDAHGLTLVYADPVADWQTALDVNLPAHLVGRLALGGSAAATPSGTPGAPAATTPTGVAPAPAGTGASSGPSTAPSTGPADAAHWASLVTAAIQHADRAALIPVSQTWRTAEDAQALHADPADAVTTGPYRVDVVDPGKRVELVRNEAYAGARPARYDRVVVRSDLDPLSEVAALRSGTADVVAPVATGDVRSALQKVPGVRVAQGGGAVLQLELQESGGGAFDPARWASGGDDGRSRAAALRAAFVGAVDRARLAALADGPTSDAVLAQVGPLVVGGPGASASPAAPSASGSAAPATPAQPASPSTTASPTAAGSAPVPVRVLVSTDDQVRRDMLGALTQQLGAAGFAVTQARPTDPATALWADPGSWDVALVPVPQSTAPVASVVARWRSGGATDVSGHRDPQLDALLDAAARQTDPAALASALAGIASALSASHVVVPVVRQPVVTATVSSTSAGRPRLPEVPAIPWGAVDLAPWWAWASTGA